MSQKVSVLIGHEPDIIEMSALAAFAVSSNFQIPSLRETWIGRQFIGLTSIVEKFIISNPRLHHFVDTSPGLAALTASLSLWIIAFLSCHIMFMIFKKFFGNPWQNPIPSNYRMEPEFEAECRRRLDGPVEDASPNGSKNTSEIASESTSESAVASGLARSSQKAKQRK